MAGLHVALLGIDSIGKTTVSQSLLNSLRAAGRTASMVTWKSAVRDADSPFVGHTLRTLYVQTYAMMYAQANVKEGQPSDYRELLTKSANEFFATDSEARLAEIEPVSNKASGLLAMAMVEAAGNIFLHNEAILPRVQAGEIVLQDSYGYKHVVKELLLMAMAEGSNSALDYSAHEFVDLVFAQHMAPDVGIYLRASPELALRYGQGRPWGIVEDTRSVGRPGTQGFLDLQNGCAAYFGEFARRHNWIVVDVVGQSVEELSSEIHAAIRSLI